MEPEQIFARLAELTGKYRQTQTEGEFVSYLEPAELRQELDLEKTSDPGDWDAIMHWVEQYLRYAVKTGHPGFINRMWSAANLPSVVGEIVAVCTNTSACTYETAPVSTLMEKYMLKTMRDLVGFRGGIGQMTTGSSNANMVAMMAARNRTGERVKQEGLFGQRELYAFVNEDAHYSMDRAANILGLGTRHLLKIPVDDHGRMDVILLKKKLAEVSEAGGLPFFVAATAGTTVRGAYDEIAPLLALRERYQFWLHVDGAWGGVALLSPRLRPLFLPHVERADSFTLDFHKMLGSALMCNVLLLNGDSAMLRETLSAGDESYIFREGKDGEVRDLGTLSLQCGRRVDSLKWFLDWKFYGQEGFAKRVERYLDLCAYAEEQVRQYPELEMVVPRESFNVCFRFRAENERQAALLNTKLREQMHKKKEYLVGTGHVNKRFTLRLLITNLNVGEAEIDTFFQTVVRTGKELL